MMAQLGKAGKQRATSAATRSWATVRSPYSLLKIPEWRLIAAVPEQDVAIPVVRPRRKQETLAFRRTSVLVAKIAERSRLHGYLRLLQGRRVAPGVGAVSLKPAHHAVASLLRSAPLGLRQLSCATCEAYQEDQKECLHQSPNGPELTGVARMPRSLAPRPAELRATSGAATSYPARRAALYARESSRTKRLRAEMEERTLPRFHLTDRSASELLCVEIVAIA
jgi:hypothetical protein